MLGLDLDVDVDVGCGFGSEVLDGWGIVSIFCILHY